MSYVEDKFKKGANTVVSIGTLGLITDISDPTGSKAAADAAREGARLSADATLKGVEKNIDFQKWLWGEQKDLAQPYADLGESAIPEYKALAGKEFTAEDMYADPGYQFGLNEGTRARDNAAGAKGMQLSGAQQRGITRYGTDYASTKFNESFNRRQVNLDNLYRMISTGQAAAAGQAATGGAMGNQVSNSIQTGANATSQMYRDIGSIDAAQAQSGFNTLLDVGNLAAGGVGSYYGAKAGAGG